jgi:hypothetical protein
VPSPHLRVTQRCLREDLGLDPAFVQRDARHFCSEHEVLRVFVVKREAAPGTGEPVKDAGPRGSCISLHVGRGRGITIWDEAGDVCWLLAYSGTHATHERRDAYQYFMRLDERDELLPTAEDYEALDESAEAFLIDGLVAASQGLYDDARANPGYEFNETFGSRSSMVVIDLVVEDNEEIEEGWISIGFSRDVPLTPTAALDVISRILPRHIAVESLDFASSFRGRPLRDDELVFTWMRSTS